MFIPIGDENPRERVPYVNYALLGANIALHLMTALARASETAELQFLFDWCLIPEHAGWFKMTTSMFLHADVWHLAGNMLFLWIFGDNVEDRMGHLPYLCFYLLAGFAADALHVVMTPGFDAAINASVVEIYNVPNAYLIETWYDCVHKGVIDAGHTPTLGASGAISGVLGAYVLFFPKIRVKMLVWLGFFIYVFYMPAWAWVGIWFGEQILFAAISDSAGSGVAWYAHIGGFLGGLGAAALFKWVLSPGLLRPMRRGRVAPDELSRASRGSSGPVVSVVEEPADPGGITFFEHEPSDVVAVLRMSEHMPPIPYISRVVAEATGEPRQAVADRLQRTRGVFAAGIPRIDAERMARTLKIAGIPVLIVEDNPRTRPPSPVLPARIEWDGSGFSYHVRGRDIRVDWSTPFLYTAARVAGRVIVDIYVTSTLRVRAIDPPDGLAEAIIRHHAGALINDGIRVLAGRGIWGWLDYPSASPYELYGFWIYNLLLEQQPLLRNRR